MNNFNLQELVQKIQAGQPTAINIIADDEKLRNRLMFLEAYIDEGYPRLTVVVLDASDKRASAAHLIIESGRLSEHLARWQAWQEGRDSAVLGKHLPGKSWEDLKAHSHQNFTYPGLQLGSLTEFRFLVSELAASFYVIRRILADAE